MHQPKLYAMYSAMIYTRDKEQAQEGLLKEVVLEGGEGNSQGKGCSSQ